MQSALLNGWIAPMHCVSLEGHMIASCTILQRLIALQCGSLTTSMRNTVAFLRRKNGRHFALITGYTLVGMGWMLTGCVQQGCVGYQPLRVMGA